MPPQALPYTHVFYGDESGDDGKSIGEEIPVGHRSTEWLVFGGLLVAAEDDAQVRALVKEVKSATGREVLKWGPIKQHKHRLHWVQQVLKLPATAIAVAICKSRLDPAKSLISTSHRMYNYGIRLLIERVTWLTRDSSDGEGCARIYFHKRATMEKGKLEEYIDLLKRIPDVTAEWSCLERFRPVTHAQAEGTRHADAIAGSVAAALNRCKGKPPHLTDPGYLYQLSDMLYVRNGNLFSYGLKLYPPDRKEEILDEHRCLRKLERLV